MNVTKKSDTSLVDWLAGQLWVAFSMACGLLVSSSYGQEQPFTRDQLDFFEKKIRPVLVEHCYKCHAAGAKIVHGGLRLDHRTGLIQGGDSGPAIDLQTVQQSLLVQAMRHEALEMPPNKKLSDAIVADFIAWIAMGAPDPRTADATPTHRAIDREEGRKFWAFQPITNPTFPTVENRLWPLEPLDQFILAKQEEIGLQPAGDADRYTWLRRVSLDLTGLLPTYNDIEAFVRDESPQAYEAVVDRLLGSRAYGERWARHWLDLTGYADMMGTSNNVYAEHAWRYRDWLIAAFNSDLPFDEFIRQQIAGDLMPAATNEERATKITATGFLMVGDVEIVNPDRAKLETDHIDSQVIKIGQAFLGMTLGCARCHDHKFDPIGMNEYYAIAGTLHSSPSSHKIPFGVWSSLNSVPLPESPAQIAEREQLESETARRISLLRETQKELTQEKNAILKQLAALDKGDLPATQLADKRGSVTCEPAPNEAAGPNVDKEALTKRRDELDGQVKKLAGEIQHAEFFKDRSPRAFAMQDGKTPGDMPIYIRGNPYAPGSVVPRGSIRVASWDEFPEIPIGQSGRLQLADWLADNRNPLTARVIVNRIWQKLFGTGIVSSVDYFGARGDRPTHPQLLDHLATRFIKGGWSQKAFLRSLVLSRTYRLSSANQPHSKKLDPENKLYWRMNRQRLDAEALRDSLLAVSGEIVRDGGGPALVLENPENCGGLALQGVNPPNYNHRKPRPKQEFERTIYLPVLRTGRTDADKLRDVFDFVDPAMIAGQRAQTMASTQSLFLLSNELIRKRATVLVSSLLAEGRDEVATLEALWIRVLGRPIAADERDEALKFLGQVASLVSKESRSVKWSELCHSLLASN